MLLLAAGPLALPTLATATETSPEVVGQACPDGEGVTVVVDATDLGGQVQVGCAGTAPGSGVDALHAAGFTDERDDAQMICAIDSLPDPCPTTWEGSYWSYWSAEADGEWQMYEVGADDSAPEPGTVEGWRYHDGSAGPVLAPAEVLATAGGAQDTDATPQDDGAQDQSAQADGQVEDTSWVVPVTIAVVAGLLAGLAVVAVRRRRAADARRDDVHPSEP